MAHNGFASTAPTASTLTDRSSVIHQLCAWLGCRNTLHCPAGAESNWLRALRRRDHEEVGLALGGLQSCWPHSLGSMWPALRLELTQSTGPRSLAMPENEGHRTQSWGSQSNQPCQGSSFHGPYGLAGELLAHPSNHQSSLLQAEKRPVLPVAVSASCGLASHWQLWAGAVVGFKAWEGSWRGTASVVSPTAFRLPPHPPPAEHRKTRFDVTGSRNGPTGRRRRAYSNPRARHRCCLAPVR